MYSWEASFESGSQGSTPGLKYRLLPEVSMNDRGIEPSLFIQGMSFGDHGRLSAGTNHFETSFEPLRTQVVRTVEQDRHIMLFRVQRPHKKENTVCMVDESVNLVTTVRSGVADTIFLQFPPVHSVAGSLHDFLELVKTLWHGLVVEGHHAEESPNGFIGVIARLDSTSEVHAEYQNDSDSQESPPTPNGGE